MIMKPLYLYCKQKKSSVSTPLCFRKWKEYLTVKRKRSQGICLLTLNRPICFVLTGFVFLFFLLFTGRNDLLAQRDPFLQRAGLEPTQDGRTSFGELEKSGKKKMEQEARASFEYDDQFKPVNEIDKIVLDHLKTKDLLPAFRCSDAVFLRRAWLDLAGRIPTAAEARSFLNDSDPNKRAALIEHIFETEDYCLYQTMRWGDFLCVKSEFPINLWPKGAAVYTQWIYESIRTNKPYDHFARDLLTASGSNFRDPPVNFWRAVTAKNPETLAANVCRVFLACRYDKMSKTDQRWLSILFSRVAYKPTAEWKEESVYWSRDPLRYKEAVMPDGQRIPIPDRKDPRQIFADWLIQPDNVFFSKAICNQIWSRLFGYGIVQEPDDCRTDNPPAIPGLLEHLSKYLVQSKYDLRQLYRYIMSSRTYQQSPIARCSSRDADKYFAAYPVRRLEAEVLQDIFMQIFDYRESYINIAPEPYTRVPTRVRTVELYDSGITNSFLEMFNRGTRDSGGLSDRSRDFNRNHGLFLINSTEIDRRSKAIARKTGRVKDKNGQLVPDLDFLWLTFLFSGR